MLYPQTNGSRTVLDLCGLWEIKIDADNSGKEKGWNKGFSADSQIGVPGSWNEQLSELGLMNYTGKIWYQCHFKIPFLLSEQKKYLRFGSVDFSAKVWVNGTFAGEHHGGYLPFELDITNLIKTEADNLLIVCVDNTLTHHTIPQGINENDYTQFEKQREQTYPCTVFDFFAYGGINRPVQIVSVSDCHIVDIIIHTSIKGKNGFVKYEVKCNQSPDGATLKIKLYFKGQEIVGTEQRLKDKNLSGELNIPNCNFWCCENPHLYQMAFEINNEENIIDQYQMDFGIREIIIKGSQLLLNNKAVFLKGFGKHEDFPVIGKGLSIPLIVKDFQLMKWIGANSFRTSHYPYAEEVMQMADKMGFLVIDEVPAVSLNFKYVTQLTLENHKNALTELINRDKNHPSVICWSIGNEPGIWGEEEANSEKAENYWQEIRDHVLELDNTRPITLPTSSKLGIKDISLKYSDILSVNRYWGWYEVPGDIKRAGEIIKAELENIFLIYKKPVLITEFGADALEGQHETYPQMFTEEYQTMLIEKYFEVIESLPFTIGEHIWNFADFRTSQHHRRIILNKKGVFNRQRQPKAAAFAIRKHWLKDVL